MDGLCACGCGQLAPLAKKTDRRKGAIKGRPLQFISGHNVRVRHRNGPDARTRFKAKVDYSPGLGPNGECYEWRAGRDRHGYGHFRLNGQQQAHRVAWFLHTGAWPDLMVCHRCDNRLCVRVEHLFLGTAHDNHADMVSKGRAPIQRNLQGKLTMDDVAAIRALRGVEFQYVIAERYGVSQSVICEIQLGKTYRA